MARIRLTVEYDGTNYSGWQRQENAVSVHIRHLRQKIEIDPSDPRYLKGGWGLGYKMEKF